jgi:glycosyltransferase involved in cell wall biosynthesis
MCEEHMTNNSLPLITFFVFAYNQETYVEEACRAALNQDYFPLEIIFSDDCSNDGTYDIMKKVAASYQGPHTVRLNRNTQNLGLIDHVNLSFRISSGELIVAASGDDISLPHRVGRIVETYFISGKSAMVIHSNVIKIDQNGNNLGDWVPPVITRKMKSEDIAACLELYIGATGAWNKKIFDIFGPLYYKNAWEDLTLGFRATLINSLCYINESLVYYRTGVGLSQKSMNYLNISRSFKRCLDGFKKQFAVLKQRRLDLKCVQPILLSESKLTILFIRECILCWVRHILKPLISLGHRKEKQEVIPSIK